MSLKTFLRTGSWYQSTERILNDDMDMSAIVDNSDPENPIIVSAGGGGVASVTAGSGISVDPTDPANPVVSATGGASYLVYTALLGQSGTDVPVPTILENTLGDIVWTRNDVGNYTGTLTGELPLNTTVINKSGLTAVYYRYSNLLDAEVGHTKDNNNNSVNIQIFDNLIDYNNLELSDVFGANKIFIEIRVYP